MGCGISNSSDVEAVSTPHVAPPATTNDTIASPTDAISPVSPVDPVSPSDPEAVDAMFDKEAVVEEPVLTGDNSNPIENIQPNETESDIKWTVLRIVPPRPSLRRVQGAHECDSNEGFRSSSPNVSGFGPSRAFGTPRFPNPNPNPNPNPHPQLLFASSPSNWQTASKCSSTAVSPLPSGRGNNVTTANDNAFQWQMPGVPQSG